MTAPRNRTLLLASLTLLTLAARQPAPTTAPSTSIPIAGDLPKPYLLDAETLALMKHVEAKVKDHSGKDAVYEGVPMRDILLKAAAPLGGHQMRGPNVAKFVVVTAADGYKVVYALAEFDAEVAERNILLADKRDGKPLDPKEGPYRMILPGEGLQARWIRQVKSITVRAAE